MRERQGVSIMCNNNGVLMIDRATNNFVRVARGTAGSVLIAGLMSDNYRR